MGHTKPTLRWIGGIDGHLVLIDQTRLPIQLVEIECRDVENVFTAIRTLQVRGAPAIGIAAAYGVCLGLQGVNGDRKHCLLECITQVASRLAESRPTAVNLFWALQRMEDRARAASENIRHEGMSRLLLAEAWEIYEEDRQICRQIGKVGAALLEDGQGVLTHCNAGGLATADYGTALAVFYAAAEAGKHLSVYVDETRPLLQGARLTAWELLEREIDTTLICDVAAAALMHRGLVQAVITGADRIAANGDTANKIGTYSVALAAAAHNIPFYVAAPLSTFDMTISSGRDIPIETRAAEEITHSFGMQTAPDGVKVYNPAFDVTPARFIRAIICQRGLVQPVNAETIASLMAGAS